MNEIRELTLNAALRAGEVIVGLLQSDSLDVRKKGAIDLVTAADTAAERVIIEMIRERYPDHAILAEESAPALRDREALHGPLWVIDPVDGTTNLVHGHRHFAVSIAFFDKGRTEVGVVHAPLEDECFVGVRGAGATLNDRSLRVRDVVTLEEALVAIGTPYDKHRVIEPILTQLRQVLLHCRDFRRNGAASLDCCWVACGRVDAYFETVKPWDIAAGALIATEAGARRGTLLPAPADSPLPNELFSENFIVATPGVYEALVRLLPPVPVIG